MLLWPEVRGSKFRGSVLLRQPMVYAMTARQRAKRIAFWRGSFITLTLCTLWLIASAYADRIAS